MVGFANLAAGKSVFHLGCGTGYYTAVIAETVGRGGSVTATKIDPSLATQARKSLARYPQVEVVEGDGGAVGEDRIPGKIPWSGFEAPLARGGFFGVNPFTLMKHFTEEADQIFGYKTGKRADRHVASGHRSKGEKGNLLVAAELPDVKKEDVRVYIRGDALVVEGERKYEKDEKREGYFHTERNYGRFCHPSSGALAERCSRARVRFSALGRALARCAPFVRIESRDGRLPRKPLDFR